MDCCRLSNQSKLAPRYPNNNSEIKGKAGTEYQYTFNTTDIDQDAISYHVNWSDR